MSDFSSLGFGPLSHAINRTTDYMFDTAQYATNNAIAAKYQKKMYQWQFDNYTGPSAMMQHYADAGLNPNIVAGNAGSAAASTGVGYPAPNANPSKSSVLEGALVKKQLDMTQAQIDNINADTDLKRSQSVNTDKNTEYQTSLIDNVMKDGAWKVAQTEFTEKQKEQLNWFIEDIKQEVQAKTQQDYYAMMTSLQIYAQQLANQLSEKQISEQQYIVRMAACDAWWAEAEKSYGQKFHLPYHQAQAAYSEAQQTLIEEHLLRINETISDREQKFDGLQYDNGSGKYYNPNKFESGVRYNIGGIMAATAAVGQGLNFGSNIHRTRNWSGRGLKK